MKTTQKIVAGAFAVSALSGMADMASAQTTASATGTGSVTIVQPISITNTAALAFGQVSRPTAATGTVTIPATAGGTAAFTGGIASAGAAAANRATFTVVGEGNVPVAFALSSLVMSNGTTGITATLTPSVTSPTSLSGVAGAATLTYGVGGALTIATAQSSGAYTGTFTVTVNYN